MPDMASFAQFRPTAHFLAPHSWMNDVCGVIWVPETQTYIMCYQWHPGATDGGNTAWGMATSKDLVTWVDSEPPIRNGLDTSYDAMGVFSGSIVSQLVAGKRVLYLFYTSISSLPLHWSIPYTVGCESQALAMSTDLGLSWAKHERNPLLAEPPQRTAATGWRDPFVSEWRNLSVMRGVSLETKYMIVATGNRQLGPQLMIYESEDLLAWKFLSVLLEGVADAPVMEGSKLLYGRNFECASFCTLGEGKNDYILGGFEEHPDYSTSHANHYALWMAGKLSLDTEGKPKFTITAHGKLDHGIFYAPHLFRGPAGEYIVSGWADEDDNKATKAQGWAGCVAFPREVIEIQAPIPTSHTSFDANAWHSDLPTGTMRTLGFRPIPAVASMRTGQPHPLSSLPTVRSKTLDLTARFTGLSGAETLVFHVRQAPDGREATSIVISGPSQTITVDRSCSSLTNGNPAPESGFFALLPTMAGVEDLEVRIIVDNSLVEVFANDRFALASRVYPSLESALGVSCEFGELREEQVQVECWDQLRDAWPARGRLEAGNEEIKSVGKGSAGEESVGEGRVQAVAA